MIMYVDDNNKRDAIWHVLFTNTPCRTMIFVNSKKNVDIIDDFLFNKGLPTTSIHADRTQCERENSIISFRQGTSLILITTRVAARGLDTNKRGKECTIGLNTYHVLQFPRSWSSNTTFHLLETPLISAWSNPDYHHSRDPQRQRSASRVQDPPIPSERSRVQDSQIPPERCV
jgi:hypothetical protein